MGGCSGSLFPTRVGLNRLLSRRSWHRFSIPHSRGAEPIYQIYVVGYGAYSPLAWG